MGFTFKNKHTQERIFLLLCFKENWGAGELRSLRQQSGASSPVLPAQQLWLASECCLWLNVTVTAGQEPALFPQPPSGEVIQAEVLHKI